MQSPNDWKNVEMTGYLKVNQLYELDYQWCSSYRDSSAWWDTYI